MNGHRSPEVLMSYTGSDAFNAKVVIPAGSSKIEVGKSVGSNAYSKAQSYLQGYSGYAS